MKQVLLGKKHIIWILAGYCLFILTAVHGATKHLHENAAHCQKSFEQNVKNICYLIHEIQYQGLNNLVYGEYLVPVTEIYFIHKLALTFGANQTNQDRIL